MKAIIIADSNEIQKIPFKLKETKKINQFIFYIYSQKIICVHSKIGLINAAAATQSLIENFQIDEIISYGAVGATDKLKIYDLVTPQKIYFHDVQTPWYKPGKTPGEKEFYKNGVKGAKKNNLGSGMSFIDTMEKVNQIKNKFDIDVFDMETAAIAQIADKNDIEISVFKCVSDIIGETKTDLENINTRISKAARISFEAVIEYLKNETHHE